MSRSFLTFFIREPGGQSPAAVYAAPSAKLDGCGISPVIGPILNLTGRDIDDQLTELDRVARGA
jgi:hypothetical protein